MTEAQIANRDNGLVKLIDRVKSSPFKPTAVKVELEGRMGRGDKCGERCKIRTHGQPHLGCRRFSDNKIANDYVLRYLAQFGLAERIPKGTYYDYGYMFKPKYPCRFSKVYNDSETEWTITIDLTESENILLLPHLVDAFNHLARANGKKKIDVTGSGMHTAFLQGRDGIYPSHEDGQPVQQQRFKNFSKSMTPLLPALYFLGANRMYRGKAVTRSLSPRMPQVDASQKYSAIAYRYGALEFRVFDTCYENREQMLDNVAVMAKCISKYWRKEYRKTGLESYMKHPVYFGGSRSVNQRINKLEELYALKDQIRLLNEGLRRIKPNYLTITDVKQARGFKRTVNNCKDLKGKKYEKAYSDYLKRVEFEIALDVAREVFYGLDRTYFAEYTEGLAETLKNNAERKIKKNRPKRSFEHIAYEQEFGTPIQLGGR